MVVFILKIKNILLLCSHHPKLDPRISWIKDYAPYGIKVHIIGLTDRPLARPRSYPEFYSNVILGYKKYLPLQDGRHNFPFGQASERGIEENWVYQLETLLADIQQPQENEEQFCWYLKHMLACAYNIYILGKCYRGIDGIIATDLDTLIPGIFLKKYFKVPLIYDAHEFWPEATPGFSSKETSLWIEMERSLLQCVDYAFTVSPQLALYMKELYQKDFFALPNCEPLKNSSASLYKRTNRDDRTIFLFQGNYAPGRGLEILLQNWEDTPEKAILHLRGPENPEYTYKLRQIAHKTGLLNKRIFFLRPEDEKNLISAAKYADVGIIPYEPIGRNNLYCCPNKLSQFCAAGLAIIANDTVFLKETIENQRLGFCFNFNDRELFVKNISYLCEHHSDRSKFSQSAHDFFKTTFNWQKKSVVLYSLIHSFSVSKISNFGLNTNDFNLLRYNLSNKERLLILIQRYPSFFNILKRIKVNLINHFSKSD